MAAKGIAFEHAHRAIALGGTLFGVTILGKDVLLHRPERCSP